MRTQTSVDNAVNDLCYEIELENCVKDKTEFFIKRSIALLFWTKILSWETYFFKIPKNLITVAFLYFFLSFLSRKILKNTNMPWQKTQMLHWLNLMIESLKMIMWLVVRCFSVSYLNMAKQTMLFDSPQHAF